HGDYSEEKRSRASPNSGSSHPCCSASPHLRVPAFPHLRVSASPRPPLPASPRLTVPVSPCPRIPLSPRPRLSLSPCPRVPASPPCLDAFRGGFLHEENAYRGAKRQSGAEKAYRGVSIGVVKPAVCGGGKRDADLRSGVASSDQRTTRAS